MHMEEYHQYAFSLYFYSFIHLFSQQYLVLSLLLRYLFFCSCPLKHCQVWIPTCRVDLKSNQVLGGDSHLTCLPGKTILQIKGFVSIFILCLSFGSVSSPILCKRCQNIAVKALHRHQIHFSMFSELCRCCLQQQGLTFQGILILSKSFNIPFFWGLAILISMSFYVLEFSLSFLFPKYLCSILASFFHGMVIPSCPSLLLLTKRICDGIVSLFICRNVNGRQVDMNAGVHTRSLCCFCYNSMLFSQ